MDDVGFYLGLARNASRSGLRALELAVGTGRVAIPLARAGIRVLGLDRSPAMLEVARRKAAGLEAIEFVEGNMASFSLDEKFGLIYIPARSFLLLTAVEDQKACLGCVREHLDADGRLALNFFNPDIPLMAAWMRSAGKGMQPARAVEFGARGGVLEWESRRYLTSTQQIDETRIEERLDAGGAVISRIYRKMGLRYVFRFEMEHLLRLCGFEVEALYGGFDFEPFTDASTEMVWVARPAAS
jgi:SAM-dependent methyltransferase